MYGTSVTGPFKYSSIATTILVVDRDMQVTHYVDRTYYHYFYFFANLIAESETLSVRTTTRIQKISISVGLGVLKLALTCKKARGKNR
jgi:hypothetical protein